MYMFICLVLYWPGHLVGAHYHNKSNNDNDNNNNNN